MFSNFENVLLQVLDEGRLTDNQGKTVDFKNTIIIMTSNLGSHLIQDKLASFTEENAEEIIGELRGKLSELLRQTIRPEFLNRIDEIVLFKPLLKNELKGIVDIQIHKVEKMLEDKNITLSVDEKAKEFLIELGYDVTYGARPLKRVIQKYLINPLSTEILLGKLQTGSSIKVSYSGGRSLEFSN